MTTVTAVPFPNVVGNRRPVTRSAPDIVCALCGETIDRLTRVVAVRRWKVERRNLIGVEYDHAEPVGPATLCEPCWDAAPADLEDDSPTWPRIRRTGGDRWDVGKRPLRDRCAWCGRPVMVDAARRRFPSCSKRCQVYYSRDRHDSDSCRERAICNTTCLQCRRDFPTTRPDLACYCSPACRQKAYRRRKSGGAP